MDRYPPRIPVSPAADQHSYLHNTRPTYHLEVWIRDTARDAATQAVAKFNQLRVAHGELIIDNTSHRITYPVPLDGAPRYVQTSPSEPRRFAEINVTLYPVTLDVNRLAWVAEREIRDQLAELTAVDLRPR